MLDSQPAGMPGRMILQVPEALTLEPWDPLPNSRDWRSLPLGLPVPSDSDDNNRVLRIECSAHLGGHDHPILRAEERLWEQDCSGQVLELQCFCTLLSCPSLALMKEMDKYNFLL